MPSIRKTSIWWIESITPSIFFNAYHAYFLGIFFSAVILKLKNKFYYNFPLISYTNIVSIF